MLGGRTGGGNPGVMGAGGLWGAGSLWEAGEEGVGGGISKRGGSREKWKKSTRRREPLQKGAGTGSVGCGRREVQSPLSPPPPPTVLQRIFF